MNYIINKYKNYHPSKWEALSFLLIPILIGLLSTIKTDDDIWFILATGKEIVKHGFFKTDPFTIHNNLHIIIQQWSFDVIIYMLYKYTGSIGLYLFTNFINIITIFIIYKFINYIDDNKKVLSVIITFIISILYTFEYLIIRPQIISSLLLILELFILEKYFKTNNKKQLYWLPIISIILINVHASIWPMMICIMIPFILNSFEYKIGKIESKSKEKKPLIIALISIIIVGFINPYGIENMLYLSNSNLKELTDIVIEMSPLNINTSNGLIHIFIIISLYCFYITYKKKIQARHILLLLGTSFIAISSNRGLLFVIITSIYPLAYYLKDYYIKIDNNKHFSFFILSIVLFIIIPFLIIIKSNVISFESKIKDGINMIYNTEKNDIYNIKLYCPYAVCTYAEYIGIKPYIDARAEFFQKKINKKEDIFKEYYYLQENLIYYKDFLDKYKFNYLLVYKKDYLYLNLLHDDEYELIYESYEKTNNKIKESVVKNTDDKIKYYIFKKKKS